MTNTALGEPRRVEEVEGMEGGVERVERAAGCGVLNPLWSVWRTEQKLKSR